MRFGAGRAGQHIFGRNSAKYGRRRRRFNIGNSNLMIHRGPNAKKWESIIKSAEYYGKKTRSLPRFLLTSYGFDTIIISFAMTTGFMDFVCNAEDSKQLSGPTAIVMIFELFLDHFFYTSEGFLDISFLTLDSYWVTSNNEFPWF